MFDWASVSGLFGMVNAGYVAALVVSMVFGTVWYGPAMGEVWAEAHGVSEEKLKNNRLDKDRLVSMACMYMLRIFVIGYFVCQVFECQNATDGVHVGILLFLGFAFPISVLRHLQTSRGNRLLLLFNLAYQLLHFALLGACVGHWNCN